MKNKIVIPFTLFIFLISGYTFAQDLINAIKSGDINAVRELLPYSNMEEKDDDAYTAYHWTAILGRTDIADLLLANGANPNALTTFSGSAMKGGRSTTLESVEDSMTSKDAVILAAEENNNDINLVNYYLSKGRMTSHLLAAVRCGNAFVTEQALSNGADVNTPINWQQQVLYDAVDIHLNYGGPEEIVDILLEHGADASTELDVALVNGYGDENLWAYLIDKGAKIKALSEDDNTERTSLLLYQKKPRKHLDFLIKNGVDLTVSDEERGRTILHWAVEDNWKLNDIKKLIPRNCDKKCLVDYLETKDDNDQTACDILKEQIKSVSDNKRLQNLEEVKKLICSDYISKKILKELNAN